jgi:hypothetical protein
VKLVDLNPKWVSHATGRSGTGLRFGCPCAKCDAAQEPFSRYQLVVSFANPLDGGPTCASDGIGWQRTGDTFETLSLTPSVDASASGHWHGFITNGEVR